MNRFFSHLIDNTIEYTIGRYKHWYTPVQFEKIDPAALSWMDQSPESFLAVPPEPPELTFEKPFPFHGDRQRSFFTFPSAYHSPHPVNNAVWGLSDRRPDHESRGALILVHGYMMSSFAPLLLFAEPLARQGIDIYFLALPYHMRRAPLGTWSGQLGLSSNVVRTANAFRQGVMDVRSLITWIQRDRKQPVILAGLSLGAFTCCMAAAADDRPAGLISLLGGADLSGIVFAGNSFYLVRQGLLKNGVDAADLERYWHGISPGNHRPKLARENIIMVAGEHDPIITPENTTKLWHAWKEPEITWLPCGHASLSFYARRVGSLVHAFVNRRLDEVERHEPERAVETMPSI